MVTIPDCLNDLSAEQRLAAEMAGGLFLTDGPYLKERIRVFRSERNTTYKKCSGQTST